MRLLSTLNIHVEQLPKPAEESFSQIVYEKFRILQMTRYKRVMFLDGDAIPLVNMDFMFRLSDPDAVEVPTILRPNLIMASRGEPCNTGMFILEPKKGAWEELQEVINKQHNEAIDLPYPHFDRVKGWGHSFRAAGDQWEGIKYNGTYWNYHASHSDQGLMYYWTKYVKQDVSIVISNRIQNWIPYGDGVNTVPKKVKELKDELAMFTSQTPLAWQHGCDGKNSTYHCYPPYRDFAHFMGKNKPWQIGVRRYPRKNLALNGPHLLWFEELSKINAMLNIGLDIANWNQKYKVQMQESPLGYMAMWKDSAKQIMAKKIISK